MKNYLFPRGCDSARVIPVIETRSARGSGAVDQPTRVVVEYWSLAGEKLADRAAVPAMWVCAILMGAGIGRCIRGR